jgi:ammonia channel protein AmtB
MASDIADVCIVRSDADTLFVASTGAIIMMMQTGFALLEVGSIRTLSTVRA